MIQPYQIQIQPSIIEDLKQRLSRTRWTDEIENEDWEYGTNLGYLKSLCEYWQRSFDWEKQEKRLNNFHHYRANIGDTGVHFIHEKGEGSSSYPILLIHGFPDSFVRFIKLIPLLTRADENGFSFDVVIPSIPGFGFSDKPTQSGMHSEKIAMMFGELMIKELGYQQFLVHGGDWGSSISEALAFQCPQNVTGLHLTDLPFHHLFTLKADQLSEPEKKYMETGQKWQLTQGGYAIIQSTTPQTVAYGLNDSPAGLASWIIEKFHRWSDCQGDLEHCYTKDELLTIVTIYWATQTINSAMRIYYETMKHPSPNSNEKLNIPVGVALFPKDLITPPREFANRFFNIKQWTEIPKGGHFAAMEQPELLVGDIRKFAGTIGIDQRITAEVSSFIW
jgi:pimeloyl-ACP methyl ester carboxylesterase